MVKARKESNIKVSRIKTMETEMCPDEQHSVDVGELQASLGPQSPSALVPRLRCLGRFLRPTHCFLGCLPGGRLFGSPPLAHSFGGSFSLGY